MAAVYYPALDGLRGIAILLVILFHSMRMEPLSSLDQWVYRLGRGGWVGVDLFFVLSGFLITGILLRNRGAKHYFRSFYARRTLRIFPLYYAMLILAFFILPSLEFTDSRVFPDERSEQWWYWTYLSNVLFSLRHYFRHAILGPTWSLAIEEQFYLFWPLVVFFCRARILQWLCLALIGVVVAGRYVCSIQGVHWIPLYVLSIFRLDALVMGALLAALVHRYGDDAHFRRLRLAMIAFGVVVVAYFFALDLLVHRAPLMQRSGYFAVAVLSGGVLLAAISARETSFLYRLLTSKVLCLCGAYSYAMYLFHHSIVSLTELHWFSPNDIAPFFGSRILGQILFTGVCTIISFVLALASWYVLEQPFLRMKRYFPYVQSESAEESECTKVARVANA